ncbi:membrane protein [Gordonia phage Secretariat]|uniref:Membrane protein n=1 Tax=Gordonia phage Secretariat TaxID=2725616 RepID=A0A6M3SWV8_9CAUD|nr:membrane protein [Gordonia phage Secretariat]QJD49618.1 membrane protein [Gordonia phage Secretariat]
MNLHTTLAKTQLFLSENRGRLGFSYGLLAGFGVAYLHLKSLKNEVELVITPSDAVKMLDGDAVGVFETKYGTIFTAMNKDFANPPKEGS